MSHYSSNLLKDFEYRSISLLCLSLIFSARSIVSKIFLMDGNHGIYCSLCGLWRQKESGKVVAKSCARSYPGEGAQKNRTPNLHAAGIDNACWRTLMPGTKRKSYSKVPDFESAFDFELTMDLNKRSCFKLGQDGLDRVEPQAGFT